MSTPRNSLDQRWRCSPADASAAFYSVAPSLCRGRAEDVLRLEARTLADGHPRASAMTTMRLPRARSRGRAPTVGCFQGRSTSDSRRPRHVQHAGMGGVGFAARAF